MKPRLDAEELRSCMCRSGLLDSEVGREWVEEGQRAEGMA